MTPIEKAARHAREASREVATLSREVKDSVLLGLADAVDRERSRVLAANAEDMAAAEEAGLPAPKLKRLKLTDQTLDQVRDGLRQIAAMDDPIGAVTMQREVPSGLNVQKVRAPLGVIAMIYEARPAVTVDAFGLCFKAGNACLLKGGREATRSNAMLAELAHEVMSECGVPTEALELITTSDRDEMRRLLGLTDDIDLVIPRGGESLIRFVHEHAKVPMVQHFHGVCHVYVDKAADVDMALEIVATGKASAPAVCNALECCLVHEDVAEAFIAKIAARAAADGITVHADDRAQAISPGFVKATDEDWGHEYLDLDLALRVVGSMEEAIGHIDRYGSCHTDAIVTGDSDAAQRFVDRVQSSCVLVNASTRFNDGFQLGLGAEIGISTSRIHAYGVMGLEELTTQRWVVRGTGQTR